MTQDPERTGPGGLPPRTWVGIGIALVVVLLIVLDTAETSISFIFSAVVPPWVAVALAALGGLVVGFLPSRRRYRA